MVFGSTIGLAFILGFVYALIIHWVSKKKLVGQTAWSVVIGVSITLLSMIPFFGLDAVALIFAYFGAAGVPMIVEYIARVQAEIQKDHQDAQELAKDLVNDKQTGNRQERLG